MVGPGETVAPPRVVLSGPGVGCDLVAHLPVEDLPSSVPAPEVLPRPTSALVDLFDAQAASRWLDVAARRMRAIDEGFYTIGSAGHESNAAVALVLRPDDPALLHYRSGGFYLGRAGRSGRLADGVLDVARGLAASVDEPIAGGRHKVFGHVEHAVIPQTSTIASHLPRALGVAWAIGRQATLPASRRPALDWPDDALAVTSFGDASANHSTAVGAINAAAWARRQGARVPLLLVCEDNGIGISTPTPQGWIHDRFATMPNLVYLSADGDDPSACLEAAEEAATRARQGQPVLLHLRCVRIGGHAGSDVESGYRSPAEVAADLTRDPLAATMRALVSTGTLTPDAVRQRWLRLGEQVTEAVTTAMSDERLTTAEQVMRTLAPRRPELVAAAAGRSAGEDERARLFGATLPEDEPPLTLAQTINRTLLDAGARWPQLVLMGEDVGRKGGVYGVTRGLQRRLGAPRVVDTLLDEQTILGMALGGGVSGLLPVPEIQYLAYLHNAIDQLRGEAATLQFFSQGRYRNPLVVRVQGLGYQKGFGGHFHNDNAIASLRDVPGVVVACPSHPSDAPALLRTALAAAVEDGTVTVVLEPIALYHERDMLRPGDGAWLAPYLAPSHWPMSHVPIGRATTWGQGDDLTIVSFGNGLRMSLRVAAELATEGVGTRVVDLRWLAPLPVDDVMREGMATGKLLVVDETRRSGAVSEGLVTALLEAGFSGRLARVTSHDSFIPLGNAAQLVLLDEATISAAARAMLA